MELCSSLCVSWACRSQSVLRKPGFLLATCMHTDSLAVPLWLPLVHLLFLLISSALHISCPLSSTVALCCLVSQLLQQPHPLGWHILTFLPACILVHLAPLLARHHKLCLTTSFAGYGRTRGRRRLSLTPGWWGAAFGICLMWALLGKAAEWQEQPPGAQAAGFWSYQQHPLPGSCKPAPAQLTQSSASSSWLELQQGVGHSAYENFASSSWTCTGRFLLWTTLGFAKLP